MLLVAYFLWPSSLKKVQSLKADPFVHWSIPNTWNRLEMNRHLTAIGWKLYPLLPWMLSRVATIKPFCWWLHLGTQTFKSCSLSSFIQEWQGKSFCREREHWEKEEGHSKEYTEKLRKRQSWVLMAFNVGFNFSRSLILFLLVGCGRKAFTLF